MIPARIWTLGLATAVLATVTPRPAAAQRSLAEALRDAERGAYGNRMAAGASRAADAQSLAPLKGILPSVRFEAGYVRTTDPIGTFGATLRQRTITQADFAPDRLNYPSAVGNYQGGVVVEQPIFNADAWAGRQAATRAADASHAQEEWTRLSTRADVVRAWYGAALATERVTMLTSAARAAHAHVTQAEAMVRQGLVTKSDALLAAVRAGEIDAQLAEAVGGASIARRQLATLVGAPDAAADVTPAAQAALPEPDRIRAVVAGDTADAAPQQGRADVRAAVRGLSAARADAQRTRSVYLPRLNSFARYDWNSADRLYAGDKNWTVGVMASWSLFAGASDVAELRTAAGREESARAAADAARARARLDAEETRTTLAVALTRLTIAEQAVRQSAEAHRIVARKYEGGLAGVVELLDAQAAETQSALGLAQARYGAIAAAADRRRALGGDPGTLVVLDETAAPVASAAPSITTTDHSSR
ncbi:MAG TPA: TolC family protein [Gemmatimonadaceae bacterium]|nr:TolC family protein [Gemmatimonadaceae bacterium]